MDKLHTVYIMAKGRNRTFYTGYSTELLVRSAKHKTGHYPNAFTKKYKIDKLVYYEVHADAESAKLRERQIKKWSRPWKMRLIESMNPQWQDLFEMLYEVECQTPACAGEDREIKLDPVLQRG